MRIIILFHMSRYFLNVCQKRITKKVLIIEINLILRATNKENSKHHLSKMEVGDADPLLDMQTQQG